MEIIQTELQQNIFLAIGTVYFALVCVSILALIHSKG